MNKGKGTRPGCTVNALTLIGSMAEEKLLKNSYWHSTNFITMPTILIVDDHSIVRKGLLYHCRVEFGYPDVGEADSCPGLMAALRRKAYTHLILDLSLGDESTLEILPNVRRLYPSLNILIFSMLRFEWYEATLRYYGIRHFISKDSPETETVRLLKLFLNNPNSMRDAPVQPGNDTDFATLSPRETEVLYYLLRGETNAAIADRLNMLPGNVATYKQRIFHKTNTENVIQLKERIDNLSRRPG